ncbi:MAG TPA: ROK family protein [Solirubrobacteraceae bacterium]|jgi:glucokinase|nr:ROK family protein [Solirubrobacteraceae bacterium]
MPAECVIGVDLGGTKILAGTVDSSLRVHHRAQRSAVAADQAALLDALVQTVAELRSVAETEVAAVGFGIPCLIDHERGMATTAVHLPLINLPFRDVMAERLGLPVFVDNDANAAMLAEHGFGAARGARHALMLTLGTGIGGGAVVDGELVRGARGGAAELGHMVIAEDGPRCNGNCPNFGCLEALASGTALGRDGLQAARAHPESALGRSLAEGHEITGALVTELAHDGDSVARQVMARIGRHLGVGLSNLVNVFNPEVIVIGGGVIAAGDLLLEPAREVVAQRALAPSRDQARIVPARFGAESGMLGAAALALDGIEHRAPA